MNRLPLLMTASISTRGMLGACFTDVERENMYLLALQYYCDVLINTSKQEFKIVFAENSGWSLNNIKQNLRIKNTTFLEFISLDPLDFDISKGKGYNELLLINKAIEQSEFIKESNGFVKVTGRYPIYNIKYFIESASFFILNRSGDLYIDIKDHSVYNRLRLGWCGHSADVRLFASNLSFYKENLGCRYMELNDYNGKLMEALFFDVVKPLVSQKNVMCRFKREPHFGGIEGSDVKAFSFSKNQDSLKGKFKRFLGNSIRLLFPRFWF